jgi:predicted RNA-binding Zn ribbon-like protein
MTGEEPGITIAGLDVGLLRRERELPQPGGRAPAPGQLVLLQSFLNTHFDLLADWGADRLASPRLVARWFGERRLIPQDNLVGPADAERVRALREGLREVARANRDPGFGPAPEGLATINQAASRAPVALAMHSEGLVLAPQAELALDRALGTLLAITGQAMLEGRWSRLKTCPGDHCGWVFYDHSRNNSGRWCSMAVCGGRTKARAHYHRHRARGRG